MRLVKHENILTYYGLLTYPILSIVTEHYSFCLNEFIYSDIWVNSSFKQIINLSIDLARALDYLHSKQILHLNFNLESIHLFEINQNLSNSDKKYRAKITDFRYAINFPNDPNISNLNSRKYKKFQHFLKPHDEFTVCI